MDKMTDPFELWFQEQVSAGIFKYDDPALPLIEAGAREAWQHLYPMVEAAYREGRSDAIGGFETMNKSWKSSTAKARLEGKDD